MVEFKELSKDDQKLICEAMALQNEATLNAIKGTHIDNNNEFQNKVMNMSLDAKLYLIDILKSHLPEEYR